MNSNPSILIVDDEQVVRDSLSKWFREDGFDVSTASSAAEALQQLQGRRWDILLLDIKMPGMDGMELQQRVKEIDSSATIIFITAHATVDTAVKALKEGAFDYVTKPVDPDYLSHLVTNALKQRNLFNENLKLKEQISEFSRADEIVGDSPQMHKVYELIETVAKTDTTVMIRGESGTGKEIIARAIHSNSSRRYFPIVAVNCGALPDGILESELFGHERGAFTGAQYRRKGKLELADGGTLFLDEVGNIDVKTQMDLLRVIETKQFTRVGGNDIIKVDFRVICATNKDLEKAVADGSFREDLYYRLNVFTIFIPPLRERKGDIPLLANYFVQKYARTMGKSITSLSPEAMDTIVRYNWPGNVRELENAIERAMVVGKPPVIRPEDLPYQLTERNHVLPAGSLAMVEKGHIVSILEQNKWNISRSAEILQIDRVTLYNKIEKYGLKKPSAG
ncbi:MAG TPA: Fis family transcriptional regulator [Bacteroidetes bacterium]|nr:MAG: Fis family transcriptional regulator [Ignavibacteria bacterium GWA2_54_16]HCA79947.1 Fis family transcriptional regulator [Bacteroidota bacterium]